MLLPAATSTVMATFMDAQSKSQALATVCRYVSSTYNFHRAADVANSVEALEVKLALKRMHKEVGRAQVQAAL